jgi:phosphoribosylformylglycinamidine synthase
LSIDLQTPFISGKDSLHNEFSYTDDAGDRQTISIPATLLISAMGQVPDVANCVTMDLKSAGNLIYQIGITGNHLGGSHWGLVSGNNGGYVPTVDTAVSKPTFNAVFSAISAGLIRSCHDLSEGGLAVAIAEMAFAGGLGVEADVSPIDVSGTDGANADLARLFSESNTRFAVEVEPQNQAEFEATFADIALTKIGTVTDGESVVVRSGENVLINSLVGELKEAWQSPLDWN